MLHDLYLLSCYFEPTQAVLYEEDLKRRYGLNVLEEALNEGLVELHRTPCSVAAQGRFFCRLSARGLGQMERVLA